MVSYYRKNKTTICRITISKMIITLKFSNVNLKNVQDYEILVFSDEDLQEFLSQGTLIKRKKKYLMIIHRRQITIECPILRLNDGRYQVIWPSFKLPNRPYPVFVYLYAAALYLSSKDSMRLTSQKVIKEFGLATFSHTTICRFLKKLYITLPYLIGYGAQITNTFGSIISQVINRKHWDNQKYIMAQQLNKVICPVLRSAPEFGNWLANQYWKDTNSFII